jgi:hypothetical protein
VIQPRTREFLIALANYVAAITPALSRTNPVALFANAVDETIAAPVYSVLRPYSPNPITHVPRLHTAIQCETIGTPHAAVQQRAELIFARLTNDYGPLKEQAIAGFIVKGILNLRPPVAVRRDDKGRDVIVFNFDAHFIPA